MGIPLNAKGMLMIFIKKIDNDFASCHKALVMAFNCFQCVMPLLALQNKLISRGYNIDQCVNLQFIL